MLQFLAIFTLLVLILPHVARAGVVGYSITITTAYAPADPFPNRLDQAFTEPGTGYLEIANTGDTTFAGIVGTIAVSAFAGDLSFTSDPLVLSPGGAVSIAIPDNSANVGGFNGPAYFFRPGVEITLNGTMSDGVQSQPVSLLVADADIHSGVWRTDRYGLVSDSFVLQGGDLWGFDTGYDFGISQAYGVYVLAEAGSPAAVQSAEEPASAGLLMAGLLLTLWLRLHPAVKSPAG